MISITLQCSCGQLFTFDVEPVNGQMPCTVACPTCGLDATHAGTQEIQRQLAEAAPVAAAPSPAPSAFPPPKEKNTLMVAVLCVAILVLVGLVGGAYYWTHSRSDETSAAQQTVASAPTAPVSPNPAPASSVAKAPAAPVASTTSEPAGAQSTPSAPSTTVTTKPASTTTKRDPSYVAVGALFDRDLKTQKVEITRVLPNSPAKKAGIVVGDVLIKVDGTPIQEMKLKEIADMFYGPVGTKLKLELFDPKKGETNQVTMVRKKFH